jgi:PhnB protein
MPKATSHIPKGYHSVIPYLSVKGGAAAIDFYKNAFGATEVMRMPMPDGRIAHAELKIGDAHVMLADEFPEMNFRSPRSIGGTPVNIMIYVENTDQTTKRAVDGGAKVLKPVQDQFYGDRSGTIEDPFGHTWTISTHIEDVPADELERRSAAMMSGSKG